MNSRVYHLLCLLISALTAVSLAKPQEPTLPLARSLYSRTLDESDKVETEVVSGLEGLTSINTLKRTTIVESHSDVKSDKSFNSRAYNRMRNFWPGAGRRGMYERMGNEGLSQGDLAQLQVQGGSPERKKLNVLEFLRRSRLSMGQDHERIPFLQGNESPSSSIKEVKPNSPKHNHFLEQFPEKAMLRNQQSLLDMSPNDISRNPELEDPGGRRPSTIELSTIQKPISASARTQKSPTRQQTMQRSDSKSSLGSLGISAPKVSVPRAEAWQSNDLFENHLEKVFRHVQESQKCATEKEIRVAWWGKGQAFHFSTSRKIYRDKAKLRADHRLVSPDLMNDDIHSNPDRVPYDDPPKTVRQWLGLRYFPDIERSPEQVKMARYCKCISLRVVVYGVLVIILYGVFKALADRGIINVSHTPLPAPPKLKLQSFGYTQSSAPPIYDNISRQKFSRLRITAEFLKNLDPNCQSVFKDARDKGIPVIVPALADQGKELKKGGLRRSQSENIVSSKVTAFKGGLAKSTSSMANRKFADQVKGSPKRTKI